MRISFSDAVQKLLSGEVVAVPTETVYGLAACFNDLKAIESIYSLKRRPLNNPLIIHIAEVEQLTAFIDYFPPHFEKLISLWPGSLTLVLPIVESTILPQARGRLPTAAFRLPNHPLTRELIRQTGPLVMPSANLSGKPSGTCAEHVEEDFGAAIPILDGGKCERGMESTVLNFSDRWEIVRLGCISAETLCEKLGYKPEVAEKREKPICPGQMFKHYAPNAKLRIEGSLEGVVLGYHRRLYPKAKRVFRFGDVEQPMEVMRNLYAVLRELDREEIEEATIDMDIPGSGLWTTIRERLQRAAE